MMMKRQAMRMIRPAAALVAALTLTVAAAACSSSSGTGGGNKGSATGAAKHTGTVSLAWSATPDFIFPFAPVTNTDGYNGNLTNELWPVLTYSGYGSQSVVNPQESLYSSITWSPDDKSFTMVLKSWKWSDGQPITSRDFTFVYNLLKYNWQNWSNYFTGGFPTDVTSVSAPNEHTVVVNLNQAWNPAYYDDDILNEIPLVPQHAWDKESVSGAVGNYDETEAGSKAVYAFLQKQGGDMSTFTTNPLWKVVDGPYTLSQFAPNGTYTYVANPNYSGNKVYMTKVVNLFYTTDVAELDALRAGVLDTGSLPLNDLQQAALLKSEGYSVTTDPLAAFASVYVNFWNPQVGPVFQQLYIRQAIQDLINRPEITSKIFDGDADPGNGPVSLNFGNLVSPLEKSGGPYPYSPATAISLLKSHGWTVVPNGVSSCTSPGTGPADCGAGIKAGQQLSFTYAYPSGVASVDQQEAAIQSWEEQAGIRFNLKTAPFNSLIGTIGTCTQASHPASTCGWELFNEGYQPYGLFPTGNQNFNTGGTYNLGGYSNPEMDTLINETDQTSNQATFLQYENYAAEQLPQLWLPDGDFINVYKSTIGGFLPGNSFSEAINPEDWYYSS
jgi:peptide/nickel transport system substrate-binding protein